MRTDPEAGRGANGRGRTPPGLADTHPAGLWFLFWGEFAERASYYGMRAILPLYMTPWLSMPDDQAAEWHSYFKAACYLLPLLGGHLADRYSGKYWTIIGLSIPYGAGRFLIGVEGQYTLVLTLVLPAGGSGVIKPNLSPLPVLTCDQQRPGNVRLRANAFLWSYFSINVGSTLAMAGTTVVRAIYGYQVAFLLPAVRMAAATVRSEDEHAAGHPLPANSGRCTGGWSTASDRGSP